MLDLHKRNIFLLFTTSIDGLTPDQLCDTYGKPEFEAVTRFDEEPLDDYPEVPTHSVFSIWFGEAGADLVLEDARILLDDFEEAFFPEANAKFESHTPLILRAPEPNWQSHTPSGPGRSPVLLSPYSANDLCLTNGFQRMIASSRSKWRRWAGYLMLGGRIGKLAASTSMRRAIALMDHRLNRSPTELKIRFSSEGRKPVWQRWRTTRRQP
jgi:hypothetical protein